MRLPKLAPFIFLAILVLAVYGNSLDNQFVSDDIATFVNDPTINNFNYVVDRALTFPRALLYYLFYNLFGPQPFVFRLINLFFHAGSAMMVYLLAKSLINFRVGLISSAIFAVHPLLTEAVTWISGGAYSQATFFMLLSIYLYTQKKGFKTYLLSITSGFLALQAQSVTLVLPLVLAVYELALGDLKKRWIYILPFALISGVWTLISLSYVPERIQTLQRVHYQEITQNNPMLVIPLAISTYLELIFWPKDLTLYHSEISLTLTNIAVRWLITAMLFVGIIWAYFKNRQIFFWLSFFTLSFLITIYTSINNITWVVAERYAYLGSAGIFIIAAITFDKLTSKRMRVALAALLAFLILILAARTIVRNMDWQNEDSLWIATGKTSPSSPNNHNNLGDVYGRRGDFEASIREFKTAIALKPNYADAHHNLGNAYRDSGRIDDALQSYHQAAQLNPYLWQSYLNIAAIYFERKDYATSAQYLQKGLEVSPQNINLWVNMGIVYLQFDKSKAKEAFTQALKIDPTNQIANAGLLESSK